MINPLAHIQPEEEKIATTTATIRRHKSIKDLHSSSSNNKADPVPALPKIDSTRRVTDEIPTKKSLGRSNTTRPRNKEAAEPLISIDELIEKQQPLVETKEQPTFSKGSLLAKEEVPEQILYRQQQQQQYEEEKMNSNTLIHIDDRIRFAKGSLLDKKENPGGSSSSSSAANNMTRSKSVREVSSSSSSNATAVEGGTSEVRRHQSLKRKPISKKHHDVPLPNTTPINTQLPPPPPYSPPTSSTANNSNNQTLLRLGDTPERFHSRELHTRHVKPLLNFDSSDRPSTTSRK